MSEYAETLRSMLDAQNEYDSARSRLQSRAEANTRRLAEEVERRVERDRAMLERLRSAIDRAKLEGVNLSQAQGSRPDVRSSDPIDLARQLLDRLETGLAELIHTRRAVAAEERRQEEERRNDERAAAQRAGARQREQAALWQEARTGTRLLIGALAGAIAVGAGAGLMGIPVAVAVAVAAAFGGFGLALRTRSMLDVRAVTRATGSTPHVPDAPQRETRLAAVAYGGAALAAASGGSFLSGVGPLAAVLALLGLGALGVVWIVLPRR